VAASRGARVGLALCAGALVAGLAGLADLLWAQNGADVQFHSFQDTRGVTVLSPTVDVNKDFTDRTALRVHFGVDAISAASDSCARCHPSGAKDSRVVFNGSVVRKYGDTKWSLGAEIGRENFYSATTFLTSISRDLNAANTTVAGGFAFSVNQPELHPSRETARQFDTDAYASLTQTLSKTTIAQLGYELNQVNGFQTSPFLRVLVNGDLTLGNVPDTRTRHTLTARLRQALPADTYLQLDYRRYLDSWQIDSNALSVGLTHHFSPQLLIGGTYRWYNQTGAWFYQPQYTGTPQFYTSDFRLVPFDSGLYSGRVVITPKARLWNLPEGSQLSVEYDRYIATSGFQSAIVTAGLHIPF
jgi:Protein of unknown function (DUF3570)